MMPLKCTHKKVNIMLMISNITSHWRSQKADKVTHINGRLLYQDRERSGSVVECLTRDQGAAGLSLTNVTGLWSLSKTH